MAKIQIIDVSSNEEIVRDMTEDELATWNSVNKENEDREFAAIQAAEAKVAILAKLGITEEEAKLLLS